MINLKKVPSWSTYFVLIVCLGSGLQQYAHDNGFVTQWISGSAQVEGFGLYHYT